MMMPILQHQCFACSQIEVTGRNEFRAAASFLPSSRQLSIFSEANHMCRKPPYTNIEHPTAHLSPVTDHSTTYHERTYTPSPLPTSPLPTSLPASTPFSPTTNPCSVSNPTLISYARTNPDSNSATPATAAATAQTTFKLSAYAARSASRSAPAGVCWMICTSAAASLPSWAARAANWRYARRWVIIWFWKMTPPMATPNVWPTERKKPYIAMEKAMEAWSVCEAWT